MMVWAPSDAIRKRQSTTEGNSVGTFAEGVPMLWVRSPATMHPGLGPVP